MLKTFQILGYSAGVPIENRGATCIMVSMNNFDLMMDCGEGSYLLWKKSEYRWNRLKYILITHMHPDHTGGLIPLLFYRKIFGIETDLTLIGPPQLKNYVLESFKYTGMNYNKKIKFLNISESLDMLIEDNLKIRALEMKHKIPCWGYRLKNDKKILVFITDTLPNSNSIKLSLNADVLIHEATYSHKDRKKAFDQYHSTEIQAMDIADQAKVKKLILTHFSPRLRDIEIIKWDWDGKSCVVFDEKQII